MLTNLDIKQDKLRFETEMEQHAICLNSINTIYVRHATIVIELNNFEEVHILTGLDDGAEFNRLTKLLTQDDRFFMLDKEMIINLYNLKDCCIHKDFEFKEFPYKSNVKRVDLIFNNIAEIIYSSKADQLVQDLRNAKQDYQQNKNNINL